MWEQLEKYILEFQKLEISKVVNFEEFNRIAIVHHSSAIEGSTLTIEESTLLITEGITSKGKPISEHNMVTDHYKALLFCLSEAEKKQTVTPELLQKINGLVNTNTGQIRNTALGICDDTKGDFRLGNVTAGGSYFVNYDKLVRMVNDLCKQINDKINSVTAIRDIYKLAFDAHYYLVSIHPWFDGNGRYSRLLMNYILAFHHQPLSIVFIEDKPQYIIALTDSRADESPDAFRDFMCNQQIKYLKEEIEKFGKRNSGISFLL